MTHNDWVVFRYLRPTRECFWKWDDLGDVISWQNNETIAFRQELVQVLESLLPYGLPRFGTVLLAIAANREGWSVMPRMREHLEELLQRSDEPKQEKVRNQINEALQRLETFHLQSKQQGMTSHHRVLLLERILRDLPNRLSQEKSLAVVRMLQNRPTKDPATDYLSIQQNADGIRSLILDLKTICHLAVKEDESKNWQLDFDLIEATGLDEIPKSSEDELSLPEQIRALVESLTEDDEFSSIANLVNQLMGLVSIPQPLVDPVTQSLGGVSDLSNRGRLDQLLLSELVHDDLTLAVRVALREALYLQREFTPDDGNLHRVIVLEGGIRTWGIPRVFLLSLALAAAATSNPKNQLSLLRAQAGKLTSIDLATREGMVEHLGTIYPELDMSDSIASLTELTETSTQKIEPVLFVTGETYRRNDFRDSLRNQGPNQLTVITAERSGDYSVIEHSRQGRRMVQQGNVNLETVVSRRAAKSVRFSKDTSRKDWPAAFRCTVFPIRFALRPRDQAQPQVWQVDRMGVLGLGSHQSLLYWDDPEVGGMLVSDHIPRGRLLWSQNASAVGVSYALIGAPNSPRLSLMRVNVSDKQNPQVQVISVERNPEPLLGVSMQGGVLCLVCSSQIRIHRMSDGCETASHSFANRAYVIGKYFLNIRTQFLECFEVIDNWLEWTPIARLTESSSELLIRGTIQGVIRQRNNKEILRILEGFDPDFKSKLGDRVREDGISITDRKMLNRFCRTREYRTKVNQVGIDGERRLVLQMPGRKRYAVHVDDERIFLKPTEELLYPESFQFWPPASGSRVHLVVARSPKGQEVYLDGRGLLHLKAKDIAIPEMTFALDSLSIGGWLSDGRYFGEYYYAGEKTGLADASYIQRCLNTFARHWVN